MVVTFWVFGAIGGRVVALPLEFYKDGLYRKRLANLEVADQIFFSAFGLVTTAYALFMMVAIWRSASNYDGDIWWARLAKVLAVVGAIVGAGQVVGAFG